MKTEPATAKKALFFLFATIVSVYGNTQNPGGIATVPQLWVKGDYSTGKLTVVSGRVSEWINEKSTFKITQGTLLKRPIWYNGSSTGSSVDSLNYSSHLTFLSASQDHLTNSATTPDLLGTAGTTFTVSNQDAGSKSAVTYLSNNVYRYQIKPNFRVQTSDGVAILSPLSTSPGYTSDFSSLYNSPRSNARITTSRGFAATLTTRRNATPYILTNSNTAPFCPGIGTGTFVGANPTNSEYFDGKIAEVIFYNSVLSDADVQKVESYLAIKYGITLNPAGLDNTNGYVSSTGTSLFSKGLTATTYWNNIIGLGRDNNTVLNQKQSHQYDDSIRLYSSALAATNVANTASIVNNTFMMTGSTKGKLCEDAATAAEVPSTVGSTITRVDREWKIINTGYNIAYTMEFKLAGCITTTSWSPGTPILLVDNDGNFVDASIIPSGSSGITISYNSSTYVYTVTIDPVNSGGLFPVNSTPVFITPAVINFFPLSITNLGFTATNTATGVKLHWQEVTNPDIDHFEIEKSYNSNTWQTIATINKTGNTGTETSYDITDKQVAVSGTVYYRIKEIKTSNSFLYSAIRTVYIAALLEIFPNPATEKLTIKCDKSNPSKQVKIISSLGRIMIIKQFSDTGSAEIDVSSLPAGIYIVAVYNNHTVIHRKLIKD